MISFAPGKAECTPQTLSAGVWDATNIITYITGNAFVILKDQNTPIQTIYDDDQHILEAIALDENSGKIAAATQESIRVYRPLSELGVLKWNLQFSLPLAGSNPRNSPVHILSWGGAEEILVASTTLSLYTTKTRPSLAWHQSLPLPARNAVTLYDSSYIATVGHIDPLVKVWRRLNYGSEDIRFDLSYLRHAQPVTGLQWRKPHHVNQSTEKVLYTFCADNVVRIWIVTDDAANTERCILLGQIDASWSLKADVKSTSEFLHPWVAIFDWKELAAAVERTLQLQPPGHREQDVAIDHLVAVANKNPEICIVFDGTGFMTVWAIENVGGVTSASLAADIYSLVHRRTGDLKVEHLFNSTSRPHSALFSYCDRTNGRLHVLVHSIDGTISIYAASVAKLLDPTPEPVPRPRFTRASIFSGHSTPVQKIVRNFSGQAVVSRTVEGEIIVWSCTSGPSGVQLNRRSYVPGRIRARRICVIRKGRFVVFLEDKDLSLWDCRVNPSQLLAKTEHDLRGDMLCLILLPRRNLRDRNTAHLVVISSGQVGTVWEVGLPAYGIVSSSPSPSSERSKGFLRRFCQFTIEDAQGLTYVLPVDPAGARPVTPGFLDVFARDVAISYTLSGRIDFWTARIDQQQDTVGWLLTCSTETGISRPSLVSGSMLRKAALVDHTRSNLTIWDVRGARLEYTENFSGREIVQDLDWTSTPDSQSILAVGFQHRVVLLSQMRYDYLNEGPAWASIREISIDNFTSHPIGDSTWLSDGCLVIGTGHQLYVYDRSFELSSFPVVNMRRTPGRNRTWDIFEIAQRANGPLPVFHPQFISQCILAGKTRLVCRILITLRNVLESRKPDESIDGYLGLEAEEFYNPSNSMDQITRTYTGSMNSSTYIDVTFSEESASAINDILTRTAIPQLSGKEQIQLADIVECMGVVEKQRRSMDANGASFVMSLRQQAFQRGQTSRVCLSWREINWAFHSTSQDILVDVVSRQYHGHPLWENARESGMFMWITDQTVIRLQFEQIARNEYARADPRNPVDCSLFYLTLRKKAILQGLWRMAGWNREQASTQKLLANDFDDPRWRTAALKNAYALLSKHRYAYAAAFFLLADHLQDAVNVCLNQLNDLQLAIAITRVYEGDSGPTLRKLLEEEVLPMAAKEGDRWLASWAFWMLRLKDMAVRALIAPVYTVVGTPSPQDMKSRSFLTTDPALVVLYAQLRMQTPQTIRGALEIAPRAESDFIMDSARVYERMGCDLLALDLVRNWKFLRPVASVTYKSGNSEPLKLVGRRDSFIAAVLPVSTNQPVKQVLGSITTSHTIPGFEEPDSNTFLDSFGF